MGQGAEDLHALGIALGEFLDAGVAAVAEADAFQQAVGGQQGFALGQSL